VVIRLILQLAISTHVAAGPPNVISTPTVSLKLPYGSGGGGSPLTLCRKVIHAEAMKLMW
jgi:hypothetical protein